MVIKGKFPKLSDAKKILFRLIMSDNDFDSTINTLELNYCHSFKSMCNNGPLGKQS